ncbi:hypothetical protein L1887_52154 [Cichorium endivia]|nr:hypothetical protein L1887_52154 [Cichorium endivia]
MPQEPMDGQLQRGTEAAVAAAQFRSCLRCAEGARMHAKFRVDVALSDGLSPERPIAIRGGTMPVHWLVLQRSRRGALFNSDGPPISAVTTARARSAGPQTVRGAALGHPASSVGPFRSAHSPVHCTLVGAGIPDANTLMHRSHKLHTTQSAASHPSAHVEVQPMMFLSRIMSSVVCLATSPQTLLTSRAGLRFVFGCHRPESYGQDLNSIWHLMSKREFDS